MSKIQLIQEILGVKPDGIWGPKTQAALDLLLNPVTPEGEHKVKATSFADPADVEAFRRCKRQGNSDQFCFTKGDNGIGVWNDDTTVDRPMCALPREVWQDRFEPDNKARGAKVLVKMGSKSVVCELRDTMPRLKNIKNGAGIDLNPAACRALGMRPPISALVTWSWI